MRSRTARSTSWRALTRSPANARRSCTSAPSTTAPSRSCSCGGLEGREPRRSAGKARVRDEQLDVDRRDRGNRRRASSSRAADRLPRRAAGGQGRRDHGRRLDPVRLQPPGPPDEDRRRLHQPRALRPGDQPRPPGVRAVRQRRARAARRIRAEAHPRSLAARAAAADSQRIAGCCRFPTHCARRSRPTPSRGGSRDPVAPPLGAGRDARAPVATADRRRGYCTAGVAPPARRPPSAPPPALTNVSGARRTRSIARPQLGAASWGCRRWPAAILER